MVRLITIILVTAAFVGGYYTGRLPGAPDIFEVGKDVFARVDSVGKDFVGAGDDSSKMLAGDSETRNATSRLGGKFYRSHHVAVINPKLQ